MMSPSLHWNTQMGCKRKKKRLSREKNNSPLNVPYGDVCWSHLDYVGDYGAARPEKEEDPLP